MVRPDKEHYQERELVQLWEEYSVLIVGHQPLLGGMVNDIIDKSKSGPCNFLLKKSRIVRIRLLRKSNIPKGGTQMVVNP